MTATRELQPENPAMPLRSELPMDGRLSSIAITDLLLSRMRPHANAIAVVSQGRSLTYKDLDRQSAQLASHLASIGIGSGQRVGIFMDRTTDLLVALLGVLRSGAAYVPLYQLDPPERLQSALEDASVSLVITLDQNLARVPAAFPALSLDSTDWQQNVDAPLPAGPSADSIAYLIFTSGSTGKPKGVEIRHGSVVNLLLSSEKILELSLGDKLLAVTTVNFDIAALELFLPLAVGGTVFIASREDTLDGSRLIALMKENHISVLQGTPHTFRLMLEAGYESEPGVKLLCGGEPWPRELADRLLAGGGRVWNLYGPTETTIWSSACEITRTSGPITLGEAIDNTYLYLLDENLQPVIGPGTGELFIGGDGVAHGYHNRPELTQQRFLPDPFRAEASTTARFNTSAVLTIKSSSADTASSWKKSSALSTAPCR
jgi:amino acid adenylation domain-containing protein